MSASIGTARHVFGDGSKHAIRVEISRIGDSGYPAYIGEPDFFNRRHLYTWIGIGGARQARVLANYLTLLADRLEARGQM